MPETEAFNGIMAETGVLTLDCRCSPRPSAACPGSPRSKRLAGKKRGTIIKAIAKMVFFLGSGERCIMIMPLPLYIPTLGGHHFEIQRIR